MIEKTLDNGMKVILVHKPDFVQSFAMIGIPAGSLARTEKRLEETVEHRAGVAHFLEHQMFYLNGKDVTAALSDVQTASNAFTSLDRTCYYVWTSADPLPAVRLLIDFVQNLELDEKTVAKEKGIILSEYAMYDQDPSYRIFREALKALYHSHPIREDILGSPEDISSMSDEDLRSFYNAFYDPSKLVMAVISATDPAVILETIEKSEERYPALHLAGTIAFEEEPEEVARKETVLHMDVSRPYAMMGIKLKKASSDLDAIRLDLISGMWLDGLFSELNPECSAWIREGIVTQSLSSEAEFETDHSHMLIFSQTNHPEEFFAMVDGILDRKPMPSREVFEGLKNSEIAQMIRNEDQFEALATDLVAAGMDDIPLSKTLEITRNLTMEDMQDWLDHTDFSHRSRILILPVTDE